MPQEARPEPEPRPPARARRPQRARVSFDLRPTPDPRPAPAQQSLEEVDYTPMAFYEADGAVALHRIVSHDGTGVVQVALLDRQHLVERWIPEVVRRHAPTDVVPSVIESGAPADCAVRAPASDLLSGIDLCVPAAPALAATASMEGDLVLQASVLGVLLLAILLAVAAIHRATTRAEQLARDRAAFVSAVSHELRTPLTTLRMHAEMLQDGLVSDARRPTVYADLVTESARLARLVENVLELSRLEEGRRPMQIREGRLGIYVSDLGEGLRRYVEQKGFTLRLVVPDKAVRAMYDAQAVEQIVTNLVDNAIKYAAAHEPREIEVAVGVEGALASIEVRDRGPGIPEAERERVFERFHRVDRPEHAHAPGTGIGLSLVRDFARSMGGDATVLGREGDDQDSPQVSADRPGGVRAEGAGGPRTANKGGGAVIRVTLPRAE
jgi:signal transduction histidine kinase